MINNELKASVRAKVVSAKAVSASRKSLANSTLNISVKKLLCQIAVVMATISSTHSAHALGIISFLVEEKHPYASIDEISYDWGVGEGFLCFLTLPLCALDEKSAVSAPASAKVITIDKLKKADYSEAQINAIVDSQNKLANVAFSKRGKVSMGDSKSLAEIKADLATIAKDNKIVLSDEYAQFLFEYSF